MTAAGMPSGASWSIGAVLAKLKPDFPEVTISKIRFLETEGLVEPKRTPSGYRQFNQRDLDRLRYVLTAQRDRYLPLKVIKEQLDALDDGRDPVLPAGRVPGALSTGGDQLGEPSAPRGLRLSRDDLLASARLRADQLRDLEGFGLVDVGPGGFYGADAVQIATIAGELLAAGLEARHLRPMRTAADRESALVVQLVAALARQRDPDAKDRAESMAAGLAATVLRLHATLVRAGLRRELGN